MKPLSLDQVIELFEQANAAGKVSTYEKFGDVVARPARAGERIETVIDGVKETEKTATAGDYVITGAKGEQYIIGGEKFAARYKESGIGKGEDGSRFYSPVGTIHAFIYDGDPISFEAPWGEQMIANPGDAIGTTAIGSRDVYRVERGAFEQTYRLQGPTAA